MFSVVQDLRLAVRQLRRSGSFTFTVILTLALGIGLNAAIFTMVDCVLLRPLGYRDADRIFGIDSRFLDEHRAIPRVGGADYVDVAGRIGGTTGALEYTAFYSGFQDGLQVGGRTLFTDIAYASPSFGQVMGVEPLAGRVFLADKPGTGDVTEPQEAMVSSAFARENFGSVAQAVGRTIGTEGQLRTVVGVMPDGFSFPGRTQVWIEAPSAPDVPSRTAYNQRAIGKLRPGVTAAMLNAQLDTLSKQLAAAYPEDKHKALEAEPLQEQIVGKIRPTLRLLMASVGVVLLIVCANITHLQLVRATKLRREVTIRTALGATRAALARRAGLEVLALAICGCGAGVLVAQPTLQLLIRLAPPEIPRLNDVRLNVDVILFSFLISLLTMAATALLPLWRSWQVDPASAMKQDAARGTESRGSGRLRQALIVGEVALTLMLSVGAVLLVRQLMAQARVDLGFAPEGLVMLDTHKIGAIARLRPEQFFGPHADPAAVQAAGQHDMHELETVLDGVRTVPGVGSVAAASGAPTTSMIPDVDYAVRGVNEFKPGAERLPNANILGVTPNYLETMRIPVLRGRGIADADRAGTEKVVVISESMARQSFAGKDPIGKQITCGWDSNGEWWTIVGVVGDVRQDSPASVPYPTIYAPISQHPHTSNDVQLMVRTRTDTRAMTAALMRYLNKQFPQVAVKGATMRENLGESQRAQRFRTLLFGGFAGVSILLAITGMYGVTAYTVAERRFEFALRFALGAQRAQVLASVLKGALTVAAVGVAGGVALSLALMRVIDSLLGEMPAFDPVSFVIAAGGVLLIALAATLQPAYRAATVEPMQVLRDE
ncbi:ABC transporter permease [Acidicapsa acidisoli]|uniref:ABC transporter permease n=1 Tax=Acidicapsa acidisoli TaxID=1615681 RepID=UPI0021DFAB4F|nr:ABC transporter permease [Acidicapsa acidisoli]